MFFKVMDKIAPIVVASNISYLLDSLETSSPGQDSYTVAIFHCQILNIMSPNSLVNLAWTLEG